MTRSPRTIAAMCFFCFLLVLSQTSALAAEFCDPEGDPILYERCINNNGGSGTFFKKSGTFKGLGGGDYANNPGLMLDKLDKLQLELDQLKKEYNG